jgi:hypothetical protein
MRSGVYRIDCGPWFYFGQAKDLSFRWRQHRQLLRSGKHTNLRLQRAFDKYGSPTFTVLARAPEDFLNRLEQRLLDTWHGTSKCANTAKCAEAAARGRTVRPESRAKMSAAYFARSPESRLLLEVGRKGRKMPGVRVAPAPRKRPLLFFVMPTGERLEFVSVPIAARHLGVASVSVSKWLCGERPWPGTGKCAKASTKHLAGLTGGTFRP